MVWDTLDPGQEKHGLPKSDVNQILDLSFKERRFIIDYWVWFRWAPVGELADYKPLESFDFTPEAARDAILVPILIDHKYSGARLKLGGH